MPTISYSSVCEMHLTPKGRRDAEAMHEGFFLEKARKFDSLTVGEFDSLTVGMRVAEPPGVAGAQGGKVTTLRLLEHLHQPPARPHK